MPPRIISIEGNIGSGKSTMVEYLKQNLQNDSTICFLQEPVDIWNTIIDKNGDNIIDNFHGSRFGLFTKAYHKEEYIGRHRKKFLSILSNQFFEYLIFFNGPLQPFLLS